mgnify:CR=1 FL=1
MGFWQRVKERIKALNTTQEWVASKIPIRADSFSRWIQRNTLPRADEAYRIAKALDTSVEYLLTGNDPMLSLEDKTLLVLAKKYKDLLNDLEELDEDRRKVLIESIHLQAESIRSVKKIKETNAK